MLFKNTATVSEGFVVLARSLGAQGNSAPHFTGSSKLFAILSLSVERPGDFYVSKKTRPCTGYI
jgi:hypothetical protein